jgi:HK97 family phage portal protein
VSLWDRLLGREKKLTSLDLWRELYGGKETKSGQRVTVETALQVAAVFACLRVLADGISQVPLKVLRENGDTREPAKDHPLYRVLSRKPNDWQTSYEWRETMMFHAGLCGRHVSFINRVRGQIVELIPFEPNKVEVKRKGYALTYEVSSDSGSKQTFPAESILHIRGPSWDSWNGLDVLRVAREAIGLGQAIEEQQAGFYSKGAQPSAVLAVDGKLTDEQYKKLKKWIDQEHAGARNSGIPMVLDNGAKWMQTSMAGVDAQTLEQRKHQVEEICRAFRVMPIMIGLADKVATYASAEQMFLAHVVHTLSPWYSRIEQVLESAGRLLHQVHRGRTAPRRAQGHGRLSAAPHRWRNHDAQRGAREAGYESD